MGTKYTVAIFTDKALFSNSFPKKGNIVCVLIDYMIRSRFLSYFFCLTVDRLNEEVTFLGSASSVPLFRTNSVLVRAPMPKHLTCVANKKVC